MKLIFAVLHAKDVEACADALSARGFVYTRFATQGGFLDTSNFTLMIGVGDDQVGEVLDILRRGAQHRTEMLAARTQAGGDVSAILAPPVDVEVGGATVFVVPLDRLEKL